MSPPKHHPPPPAPPAALAAPPVAPLLKQKSWSPDSYREELWLRRKEQSGPRRRSKSLTDDDFDELKACIELGFGFGFESLDTQPDPRLSNTLPALEFYLAVNKSYNDTVLRSNKSSSSLATTSSESDLSLSSPVGSPLTTMFWPGDDPQTIKTRLRHWAQVVACSVKQSW
ncbi:uncharacterized protein LOC104883756 [Beta vulgaris subsp. vulgaris]|uniref:uncharacterized protein LOC104883756 n=1 Tax=Beta vulgaris subsp. vulgaris TaxID=3555 RepID=UPI00203675F6|nr:uncharacterized protein LOC104883756 [Beta vulgaris subsp. vulgaris]